MDGLMDVLLFLLLLHAEAGTHPIWTMGIPHAASRARQDGHRVAQRGASVDPPIGVASVVAFVETVGRMA